jgi:hypothetical protein
MNDSRELRAMRLMAWCRVKGELCSMLATHEVGAGCIDLENLINDFIKEIEKNPQLYLN